LGSPFIWGLQLRVGVRKKRKKTRDLGKRGGQHLLGITLGLWTHEMKKSPKSQVEEGP